MMSERLRIKLVRSTIGYRQQQRDTVKSLGLRRLHQVVERPDTPIVRGQIFKVRHLVEVEEV
jgi:large subunit ribosomal protein L30